MDLRALIRDVPDFPSPGILFRDITPLLGNPEAFALAVSDLEAHAKRCDPGVIVAIDSRGFLFGGALAERMALPLAPVRKAGKLPAARMSVEYSLEYGQSRLDIHADALVPGTRAYIVDDLLATGGTAAAAAQLVTMLGGEVAGFGFVVELAGLAGRQKLAGHEVHATICYD